MALRDWNQILSKVGIADEEAKEYIKIFDTNKITPHLASQLTNELLKDLGIKILGHRLAILQFAQAQGGNKEPSIKVEPESSTKIKTAAKAPIIKIEMSNPDFRKFKIDWQIYKDMVNLHSSQVNSHLYSACESDVQKALISTTSDFLRLPEAELLDEIEKVVTRRSNPMVHRVAFGNLYQAEGENVKDFVRRLQSAATDCEFSCVSCKYNLGDVHIMDQLIRGMYDKRLQADVLAKAASLRTLESILNHAEAFETALYDQSQLLKTENTEVMNVDDIAAISSKKFKGRSNRFHAQNKNRLCNGCGGVLHQAREAECPAWGKNCTNCGKANHFASVCFRKGSANAILSSDTMIAHVQEEVALCTSRDITEIPALLTPVVNGVRQPAKEMMIFPDSGASICLAGTKHMDKLGISANDLSPCLKEVRAVGGTTLICEGWIPIIFSVDGTETKQPLFICNKIDRIYFSKQGCYATKILPDTFPNPMKDGQVKAIHTVKNPMPENERKGNEYPRTLPYPATEENIPKLKQHLIDSFPDVFSRTTPFQAMKCQPVHIHIKPDAKPHARHVPIPIPLHWRNEIKEQIDQDVAKGVIEQVPVGEPVTWCSPMVVTVRKDGRPRRTVDLQKLNAQCIRETHHCESPFKLACQVPSGMKKTVIDATDGYHSIPLDEASRHLTTFITPWGRYRYLRLPQGFMAAGDAYTRRYDEIIKDVNNKVKCVDDALLYEPSISENYKSTWNFLKLCQDYGISVNANKFQFCQDNVLFAGLQITNSGIRPAESILAAIRNFPAPKNISDARSWFGLVNQIAWAYSNGKTMQPFRELVKHNHQFHWDENLERLFHESKDVLIDQSIEGIQAFDLSRKTCLQTDWCKEGIGYLLLQQHCSCAEGKYPICCKEGWKLVFAGSRFTKGAETNYSPTEGEALAVAWSLEHARMFVLGCKKLIISTDHKPLLGILNGRDLSSITNSRLLNLKQRTLPFEFQVTYNPGKWHRAADAVSRKPSEVYAVMTVTDDRMESVEKQNRTKMEAHLAFVLALMETTTSTTMADIAKCVDEEYQLVCQHVATGFPANRNLMDPRVRNFWSVRNRLSLTGSILIMDDRLVIPKALRRRIVNNLHSAHQGITSMLNRASQSLYWPGMVADIRNRRLNCERCNELASSQPKEPIILTDPPVYPFQKICADYFSLGQHSYLTVVDRFTSWIMVYHFADQATADELISVCRGIF